MQYCTAAHTHTHTHTHTAYYSTSTCVLWYLCPPRPLPALGPWSGVCSSGTPSTAPAGDKVGLPPYAMALHNFSCHAVAIPSGKHKAKEQDQKAEGQDQKAECAYLFCSLKGDDLLGLLNALLCGTAAGHSLCFVCSRLGSLAGAWTQGVLCTCFSVTYSTNDNSI